MKIDRNIKGLEKSLKEKKQKLPRAIFYKRNLLKTTLKSHIMDISMDMTHYVILCCQLFFEIAKQEIKMSFFFYGDFLHD